MDEKIKRFVKLVSSPKKKKKFNFSKLQSNDDLKRKHKNIINALRKLSEKDVGDFLSIFYEVKDNYRESDECAKMDFFSDINGLVNDGKVIKYKKNGHIRYELVRHIQRGNNIHSNE